VRVLHVIGTLDPAAGGPPAVVCRLSAAQAAAGDDVAVLCYGDDQGKRQAALEAAVNRVPGFPAVQVVTLPPDRGMGRITASHARQALRQWCESKTLESIVHLHGVWEPLLKAAADVARRHHMPYILTPHGMLDPWALRQRRIKKGLAMALGYRAMIHQADAIHALNATEAQLMAPLRLATPPAVAPNAVFLEELPGELQAANPATRPPAVLFLGRLHAKKGLDLLAEAFTLVAAQHAAAELVVAGPDAGAEADFRRAVRRLGLEARVRLPGALHGQAKWQALAAATCFCLPSKQEGFSVAALEALACGVPVVLSEGCHFPEVAQAGAGLIVPREPEPLADALLRLLNDPTGAAAMGRRGRDLVRQSYTWPVVARQMKAIYQSAFERRAGRADG
jgi:glycosyltransferase involved in cell wall biosynthesis